jgi:hypothetical protein
MGAQNPATPGGISLETLRRRYAPTVIDAVSVMANIISSCFRLRRWYKVSFQLKT